MSETKKYKYKAAFALMIYRCAVCEHTEIIYNSRDGATPYETPCPVCNPYQRPSGNMLDHVAHDADRQVSDFKPSVGMAVWIGESANPRLGIIE